ncbi:signal recognition particle-docking protein FtsY [Natronococcus sp. A-GB7]|uniref:signal recognition particle-docking protein FtsY n=1 Tax=Natronococcus sp. A-GB7 TaxID=3037649 RepID=UPI00241E6B05|nr:signal recognition particle-docking protein FtsY [Natronococcus sp. A-GB7]MDG5819977.1 signal recognition particle-docking protein FtsY [Natronococcus sp. A-GB7]
MFDNLKKKLGSFREDAEEAAEENVEEVDEESAEALAEEPADDPDAEAPDLEESPTEPDEPKSASEPAAPDTTEKPVGESDVVADRDREVDTVTETADASTDETARGAASSTEPAENAGSTPVSELERESAGAGSELEEPDDSLETGTDAEPETEVDPETDVESVEAGAPATIEETDTVPADGEDAVDAASPAPEAEPEPAVDDAESAPAPEAEDSAEAETETEDNGSTGFGAKARSLVKGKFVIEEEDLEEPLHELEMALLTSDVEMGVAEEICDNVRDELVGETRTFTTSTGEVVEEALRDAIYDVISVGQFDFDERIAVEDKPAVLLFTGVNGVGKTTTIAKLSRYLEQRGYSTVLANGDTYRAGANQQIQQHADALDTKCISHEQGGDPAAVLYDAVEYAEAHDVDVVLADTAGRLHTDEGLMDQLEKIDRVVGPDLTLFVDEAVAGQDAVNRAREFNEAAAIDGAILSKADADSNGGAAISIAHVTGKPILFLGVGQEYDDLERFDPDEMVERLLADEE